MLGKLLMTVGVSMLVITNAYCGDIGDAANAVTGLTSIQGNGAVGVNSGSGKANISSEATGKGSRANAGLGVVDAKSSSGKSVNLAVGVNTAKADIKAKAASGGTANAGLGVVSSH